MPGSPSRYHKAGARPAEDADGAADDAAAQPPLPPPLPPGALPPDVLARAAELASTTEEGASSRLATLRAEWEALQGQLAEAHAAHDSAADAVAELGQELAFMNRVS